MPEAEQLAREYELIYILRPTVGPSEARKVSDRVSDIVEKGGAKLTRVDNWGKRKLAYPIRKHTRGVFVLVKFVGFGGVVAELERNLRILDDVVRWQTIRMEGEHDLTSLDVDPDEVQFRDIEATEEEEEPTFEERLGMRSREREREKAEKAEAEKAKAEEAKAEEAKAEEAEAEEAEAEEAEAEKAEPAEGEKAEAAEKPEGEASSDEGSSDEDEKKSSDESEEE